MSIRVAVVDDQALVRAGFAMVLNHQPDIEVVAQAANGREAVEAVRLQRPEIVLMDIRMPEMDGLEATARILSAHPESVQVIIVTTFDPDEYVYQALRAGATGFLLKDTPPEELVHAVRTVARGGALLSPALTRRLIGRFAQRLFKDHQLEEKLGRLTPREREVLLAMARGASNHEIAKSLCIGDATVKSHVSSVLAKLDLRDRVQAVVFAYESGLAVPRGK